ncbi:hypothetical protein [Bradyrhizobium genosp. P]|uniref:hypothetical protein n=1 Tax=Bradyrhizobium genosp. P TaxID=83641 RepID=UPI003CFB122B
MTIGSLFGVGIDVRFAVASFKAAGLGFVPALAYTSGPIREDEGSGRSVLEALQKSTRPTGGAEEAKT